MEDFILPILWVTAIFLFALILKAQRKHDKNKEYDDNNEPIDYE